MLTPEWSKSSFSSSNANCVEARASADGIVAVRDSKNPSGPVLQFSADSWQAFVTSVKAGRLGTGED